MKSSGTTSSVEPLRLRRRLTPLQTADGGLNPDAKIVQWHEQLTEPLARTPGVTLVSSTDTASITGDTSGTYILVPGYTPRNNDVISSGVILCMTAGVGASYFSTLRIRRSPTETSRPPTSPARRKSQSNEAFAKHFFGGQNPRGALHRR